VAQLTACCRLEVPQPGSEELSTAAHGFLHEAADLLADNMALLSPVGAEAGRLPQIHTALMSKQ
jgi:hypothetical protein